MPYKDKASTFRRNIAPWYGVGPEKVRVRNKLTNETLITPRNQWNRVRGIAGKYPTFEAMWNALRWASTLGDDIRKDRAVANLSKVLDTFDLPSNFDSEIEAIKQAFEDLPEEMRAKFWERNDWLMRQTYNYYREYIHISPETATFGIKFDPDYEPTQQERELWTKRGAMGKSAQPEIIRRLWSALSEFGIDRSDYL